MSQKATLIPPIQYILGTHVVNITFRLVYRCIFPFYVV